MTAAIVLAASAADSSGSVKSVPIGSAARSDSTVPSWSTTARTRSKAVTADTPTVR
ncbi:Uncharacterised protein [Mycobacteroides abscessus subsp. abscessus]|nr:Uncharacterised protein [Mycobacteroides abscessus subsp. abscessus]